MLTGLQNEIENRQDLLTASRDEIIRALNADGTALVKTCELIPLTEQKIKLSKLSLLTYLTPEQRYGLRAMLNNPSDAAQDFKMLYEADNEFWVNDNTFQAMMDMLGAALSISPDVVAEIKQKGGRIISRAEELFSKKISAIDFE